MKKKNEEKQNEKKKKNGAVTSRGSGELVKLECVTFQM